MATKLDGAPEAPEGLTEALSKAGRLRAALQAPGLAFIMEAHNGLSAKIVEEAGFEGIWASGLAMSSALGVRDNNEASWTQVLEMLEFMADATTIPILVDGDTGYGNFNNVRRLVKKLCQRGIAGVCIEDKLFPKTNSFIGQGQPLADIDEFCGRIKAGKDSQTDDAFNLVARVEALISGWGMDEALKRAEAYHRAGADAILIHSKQRSADEILGFANEWAGRSPLVIVPTMYYATPTPVFADAGVSLIIWANHNLRAAITAMRETSRRIMEDHSLTSVEGAIASVKEVFSLVGQGELSQAEQRYLAPVADGPHAVVLAASRGDALAPLTEEKPKCMLDVRGQPLLRRLVSTMNASGVRDITVVRGYRKEAIDLPNITTVDNDAYAEGGEAASLACAVERLRGACLVSYGDILFRNYILENLLAADGDIVLVVDVGLRDGGHRAPGRAVDAVRCSRRFTGSYLDEEPVTLSEIGGTLAPDAADGEFIGLVKLSERGSILVRDELDAMRADGKLDVSDLPELFARLLTKNVLITVLYITGHWLDVDDAFDLAKARNLI
jgi:phosphoenolpyruvate phosphomutase